MFKALISDYFSSEQHREEKLECYARYTSLFLKTVYGQITAPLGYVDYYLHRKRITHKLEELYSENNLGNIENIGKDIINGRIDEKTIKECLGKSDYRRWLYGDTDDPINTGGVPADYKPDLPMFVRRWFYSGLRNPRWNATYIDNYSSNVVKIATPYDDRSEISTSNYGTTDTRLGTWLRWYVDDEGKWWFFYETTKQKSEDKGKLFYFGAVGLGSAQDGDSLTERKQSRFEFSLNRTVTIDK